METLVNGRKGRYEQLRENVLHMNSNVFSEHLMPRTTVSAVKDAESGDHPKYSVKER